MNDERQNVEDCTEPKRGTDHAAQRNYSIAVDFDGVIHSYTSKWVAADVIPDPPVSGASNG